ncbi:nuclear transport factor 2 family protein [Halobium palmae]|uniref:Nuclear transport factor 2 family protein n=1 Tax=Halobium palmae TaxID=1776492 RepID=A0ABD5S3A7_9EURY
MNASAESTVRDYYEVLRRGEPLYPYFAERDDVVKFGIGERLTGYDEVAEGLREQSRTTEDWTVDSRRLVVVERDDCAWFSDDVGMAWRDVEAGEGVSIRGLEL